MSEKIKFYNFDHAVSAYFGLLDSYNNVRTHLLSECKNHKETQAELTAANARIAELQGQLDEQDEINMNQINKIADLEIKLSKSIEYCSKHLDLMWAASIVSILLDCDFREARDVVGKWRLENERSKTSPCGD